VCQKTQGSIFEEKCIVINFISVYNSPKLILMNKKVTTFWVEAVGFLNLKTILNIT